MSNPFDGLAASLGIKQEEIDKLVSSNDAMLRQQEEELKYAKQQMQMQQAFPSQLGAGALETWGKYISPGTITTPPVNEDGVRNHEVAHLMVVTLVTVVGPVVAKKLVRQLKIRVTPEEIDKVYQEVKAIMEDDHDEDLTKVIDECAKEMKI